MLKVSNTNKYPIKNWANGLKRQFSKENIYKLPIST